MNTFPCHGPGPLQRGLAIGQLGAVPVLFQDSPATLHRIVLAVVRRIVVFAELPKDRWRDPLSSLTTPNGVCLFLAPHVVVGRLVVTPRLATARVVANIHRRLAVHAQAHDRFALAISVMRSDVGQDGVGFADFFFGVWPCAPDVAGTRSGSTLPTCSFEKAVPRRQIPALATACGLPPPSGG